MFYSVATRIVASQNVYNPLTYVEMMTGKFYIGNAIGNSYVVQRIEELLLENGIDDIRSFALDEIEAVIKGQKRVVLVDCVHYEKDMMCPELRWFQINDDTIVDN